jgi:16S rRNA (guanine527-N7)-methyltransferase
LTSITDLKSIIYYHFQDSLKIQHYIDFKALHTIADVGTGGGFPGIPLKIRFPHVKLVLIEVNHKKISFLEEVIRELNLTDITIYDEDWRTFLRKTDEPIELFCARASLQPVELIRMFQPSCVYRHAKLVYWASTHWQAEGKLLPYVQNEFTYSVGARREKFVLLESVKKE